MTVTQNYVTISNGTGIQNWPGAVDFMAETEYRDANFIRGIFPQGWNITEIEVRIAPMENVTFLVVRSGAVVSDLKEGVNKELLHYMTRLDCSWNQPEGSIARYEFSVTHQFYSQELPRIHKEVYDSQFHKDFENTITQK